MVTARHVADVGYDLHARVKTKNKVTGKMDVVLLKLPRNRWVYHPVTGDENTRYVDVAVMRIRYVKDREIVVLRYEPPDSAQKDKSQFSPKDPEPPQGILVFGFPGDIGFDLLEQRPLAD